jgi:hypothetical protein
MMTIYTVSAYKKDYYETEFTEKEMKDAGYDCPKQFALDAGIWDEDHLFNRVEGHLEIYCIDKGE